MKVMTSVNLYMLLLLGMMLCQYSRANWEGDPPLMMIYQEHQFIAACREGRRDVVQYWLDQDDFDIDQEFESGLAKCPTTGLYCAAQEGHADIVKLFLDKGAKPDHKVKEVTPLHQACIKGRTEVVKLLIGHTANVDFVDPAGNSSLYMACLKGHTEVVNILVEANADLNLTGKGGATALYIASRKGHMEIVKILLAKKADPTMKYHFYSILSKSPLTAAKRARPLFRGLNPDRYDAYTSIIYQLSQAVADGTRQLDSFNDDVAECSPLIPGMQKLPSYGVCK